MLFVSECGRRLILDLSTKSCMLANPNFTAQFLKKCLSIPMGPSDFSWWEHGCWIIVLVYVALLPTHSLGVTPENLSDNFILMGV